MIHFENISIAIQNMSTTFQRTICHEIKENDSILSKLKQLYIIDNSG